MTILQCPYCGAYIDEQARVCPKCRESLAVGGAHSAARRGETGEIRRGVMSLALAAGLRYLSSGQTAIPIPFEIPSVVGEILVPLLFLAGVGLIGVGAYLRLRS